MAIAKLVPRNQLQSSGLTVSKVGRVTNNATGLYTVPTGKKARVTSITMSLDAVGADATYAAAVNRSGTIRPVGEHVIANRISIFTGEMMLQAGDVVTNVGDAGSTNGTCDMTCTFQEYNV